MQRRVVRPQGASATEARPPARARGGTPEISSDGGAEIAAAEAARGDAPKLAELDGLT